VGDNVVHGFDVRLFGRLAFGRLRTYRLPDWMSTMKHLEYTPTEHAALRHVLANGGHMTLLDDNRDILAALNFDETSPRTVEFFFLVAEERAGELREAFVAAGVEVEVVPPDEEDLDPEEGEPDDRWDVHAVAVIEPTAEKLTETEQKLRDIANNHGAEADGWGFLAAE